MILAAIVGALAGLFIGWVIDGVATGLLMGCVFTAVLLTGCTVISVFNRNGARLSILFVDAAAITGIITHCMGVW